MNYLPEPQPGHRSGPRTAVLLVNLGTPDAPTPAAVRRFLAQFLSDPRVVEIPRAFWLPILYGIILTTRPRKSARKYASIWSQDGSPLRLRTEALTRLLRGYLASQPRSPLKVEYAMRYGEPSIPATLTRLKSEGCDRILVLPLYPQYAASTTASAIDAVAAYLQRTRNVPEIRVVKHFHDHPGYIAALARLVRDHWALSGPPDKLVMSFHGLPRYALVRGDPYHRECQETARLLAEKLELAENRWQVTFQSRFGAAKWLEPYTAPTLADFGRKGLSRVDVVCPGFLTDCLETLEEIGIEGRGIFLRAGGKEFHLLSCLNERDDWVRGLATIVQEHLADWTNASTPARSAAELGCATA